MLIPPFLLLEPVKMVHHLSKGRSMFGLVRHVAGRFAPLVLNHLSIVSARSRKRSVALAAEISASVAKWRVHIFFLPNQFLPRAYDAFVLIYALIPKS